MSTAQKSKRKRPSHPALWNPELLEKNQLPPPFDELQLDWADELAYYVASNKFRIYKKKLAEGWFLYDVTDEYNRPIISVETGRDLQPEQKKKRRRK